MAKHLVFTLYGPLQAWGTVAVGEIRPCSGHPTRSGVLGLLAAALGIRRGEDDRLRALSDGYGMAVRVDDPGDRFTDYHTIQTPQEKRKRVFYSRRDELGGKLGPHEPLNTILSRRDYLTDARFTVCLRARSDGAEPPLERLREALRRPELTPYLGRKSCPAGLPFMPSIVEADDALAALAAYAPFGKGGCSDEGAGNGALHGTGAAMRPSDAPLPGAADASGGPAAIPEPDWRRTRGGGEVDVFCDEGMCPGEPIERLVARDVLDDHTRRAFGTRLECRHRMNADQGGA